MDEPLTCPYCLEEVDAPDLMPTAGPRTTARPRPGDLAICVGCGLPSYFDAAGDLRRLRRVDLARVAGTPDHQHLVRMIAAANLFRALHYREPSDRN